MKTCLIVDRNPQVSESARAYFKRSNFRVHRVGNTEDAMTACRENMPDVIFVDASASGPGKSSGLLKSLSISRDGRTPVVIYCADDQDPALIGAAIWDGAYECLVKPFDDDLLDFKLVQAGLRAS